MARGARLGRGRPNRPIVLRNTAEDTPPPVIGSVPVIVVSPWRRRPPSRCLGTRIVARNALVPPPTLGNPVLYRITGPHKKWVIGMAVDRMDATSRKEIPFEVSAFQDGRPYDVTVAVAEAAFLLDSHAKPSSGDWKACTWDTNLIGTYVAKCLVGQGGTFEPTAGHTYFTWVRVSNSATSEIVQEQVGQLIVE